MSTTSTSEGFAVALAPDRLVSSDGTVFRDLNGNGVLDLYEDPRRSAEERTDDLLSRLTLAEKAGLMFHTMVSASGDGLFEPEDDEYPAGITSTSKLVGGQLISHFNVSMKLEAAEFADWQNRLQHAAAQTRLGIPVTLSTDPVHGFLDNPALSTTSTFSRWPEPLGFGAAGDPGLVREFAEIARQEYVSVGLRVALHPMADLATEPRWSRVAGTFGADADLASRLITAYIEGFQTPQLGHESVACMTKHFPGAGPQLRGEDAHFPYGREQVYPGRNWEYHLRVFEAAFAAGTAQVMPYYAMPVGLGDDEAVETVGFGFNHEIITGWLRGRYGFQGVVCSDWGLVTDTKVRGVRWPARSWGAEHLSRLERVEKIITAGCDQLGGEACPELLVELVQSGRVAESRIDESARRILLDKFRLGLFDNPFVDSERAVSTVGRADFMAAGRAAQRQSMVLLKNHPRDGIATLPLTPGTPIHIEGIDPTVAGRYGTVTTGPDAVVSVIRLEAPFEDRNTPGIDYEPFFRAGLLDFPDDQLTAIRAKLSDRPAVVVILLDRPAAIPEIDADAAALVAEFGATDEAVLDVIFGHDAPRGRLPTELPSSTVEVESSREDVPGDTANPLYPIGFGLSYQANHTAKEQV